MPNRIFQPLLALLLVITPACDSIGEPGEPPEDRVRILWNPQTGEMPTPTDLVRDDAANRLDIPVDDDATLATRAFTDYLNTLDGYPLSTPIRIPVSGPIDEATLNRGLTLVAVQGGVDLRFDAHYDDETMEIIVEPREPLEANRTYVVAVRGYGFGLRGQNGRSVIADPAFFLVRSAESLRDHPDAVPGDTAQERQETADALAELQDELQPAFELMEQQGIEREELAALFQFTTTSQPAIAFDTSSGKIPLPNGILVDPDGDGLDLPIDDDMNDEERQIREELSTMEGFAISGSIVVESTHDFAPGEPSAEDFRLFERRDDQWLEVQDLERGRLQDEQRIWMRPELTLEPDTEYVYLATTQLVSRAGHNHRPQPMGAMLLLDAPLVDDDGSSALEQLTDDEARRLEPHRQQVNHLLYHLWQSEDLDRADVAVAVPFRTTPSVDILLERRAELYEKDIPTEVIDIDTTWPSGAASLLLHNVEAVIRGKMPIYDHLDPETRAFRQDGEAEVDYVKFVLTLPEDVSVAEPIPVVLFGHGLMTSRELLYLIASVLATEGYAAFAPDLPYHGSRAVCIRDEGCVDGATCDDIGQCRYSDGTKAELKQFTVPHLAPFLAGTQYEDLLSYPIDSGEVFIDMNSIPATRDHFAQALLDLQQSVRVIQAPYQLDQTSSLADWVVEETGLMLGDEILYLGMSLGGILGSGLSATEAKIENFVLNVPAADLTQLIEHSHVFRPLFENALDDREITEGSDAYFQFMNAARWILDPVDPLNLVQHTVAEPLTYVDPETGEIIEDRQARVLIQQAEGDLVVPNVGTAILSERMGVDYINYEAGVTDHAFLFDPTNLSSATRQAREDIVEFFENR